MNHQIVLEEFWDSQQPSAWHCVICKKSWPFMRVVYGQDYLEVPCEGPPQEEKERLALLAMIACDGSAFTVAIQKLESSYGGAASSRRRRRFLSMSEDLKTAAAQFQRREQTSKDYTHWLTVDPSSENMGKIQQTLDAGSGFTVLV